MGEVGKSWEKLGEVGKSWESWEKLGKSIFGVINQTLNEIASSEFIFELFLFQSNTKHLVSETISTKLGKVGRSWEKLGKVGKVGRSWEKSRFWSKVDVDEKNYLILHPTCIDR